MICSFDISNMKSEIDKNIGQKVLIKGKKERKKVFEEKAIIESTYPDFFTVKSEKQEINTSYQYKDILRNELQVSIFNGEEYFPLTPTVMKTKF